MIEKRLAKITAVRMGWCGYQDAQFGFELYFGGEGWGIGGWIRAAWGNEPSEHAKWTEADQIAQWGAAMKAMRDLTRQAKVESILDLKGKPVEVTIDDGTFKDFRILTEVL